jgi:hypothetical protein
LAIEYLLLTIGRHVTVAGSGVIRHLEVGCFVHFQTEDHEKRRFKRKDAKAQSRNEKEDFELKETKITKGFAGAVPVAGAMCAPTEWVRE